MIFKSIYEPITISSLATTNLNQLRVEIIDAFGCNTFIGKRSGTNGRVK